MHDRDSLVARRRATAERARRRRVVGVDLMLGLAAGVLVLVLGPGLAPAALPAAIVLLVGGASYAVRRRRRSRLRHDDAARQHDDP